jgi:hypothetical protein
VTDILARTRSGDLSPGERATLADLVAALLGFVETEHAAQRTADLQADTATRLADSRARVDAALARLLADDRDPAS